MFRWLRKSEPSIPASRVSSLVGNLVDAAWNATGTMTWRDMFGIMSHERSYTDQSQTALRLSAVFCGVKIYTGMINSLPRRMYALEAGSGERTRVVTSTEHPAARLFSHYFHPELLSDDALMMIVYDVLMDGNCYFLKETDTQGRTSRLYYIHPSRICRGNIFRANGGENLSTGRVAASGELLYRIDTGLSERDLKTEPLIVPKDSIAHFRSHVLDTQYHRGQGFIQNNARVMDLYSASEEFGWKFYTRGIATQMFLTTENRLDAQVLKRIEANFSEDPDAPLESIFRTRVLEQGLKPVHMGIPFQHLQFIETRAFSVEDIARGLNVPPVLLHSYMGTKAGDVDISAAMSMFIQSSIGPLLSRICSQFRTEVLPIPSHMLFLFEFEQLYLYRNVIDKFSNALRNLFETGIINRRQASNLLGMHIDPRDAAADPRYVPVNLMTVEHSLHLEEGARLANEATTASTEAQQKANEGMVSAEEYAAVEQKAAAKAEPPSGRMDKSPSQSGIDKRLRNAFMRTVNGIRKYEQKVLEQKRQSRPDDYEVAVSEFYAADGKLATMLNEQVSEWSDTFGDTVTNFVSTWLSTQKFPEGIEDEINRTEQQAA